MPTDPALPAAARPARSGGGRHRGLDRDRRRPPGRDRGARRRALGRRPAARRPRRCTGRLGSPPLRDRVDWQRVHVWWGDDRFVPADHPASNVQPLEQILLATGGDEGLVGTLNADAGGARPGRGHRRRPPPPDPGVRGDRPRDGHRGRGGCLRRRAGDAACPGGADGLPVFDVLVLGVGGDGHLLSVFPGSAVWDRPELVVGVPAPTHIEPHIAAGHDPPAADRCRARGDRGDDGRLEGRVARQGMGRRGRARDPGRGSPASRPPPGSSTRRPPRSCRGTEPAAARRGQADRSASVGGTFAARSAGYSPAIAPTNAVAPMATPIASGDTTTGHAWRRRVGAADREPHGDAERAAERREQQRLPEELPRDRAAGRPERAAEADLRAALEDGDEHHVRDPQRPDARARPARARGTAR